ncbi:MAG: hypothetical protein QF704_01825 [Anaerolineales bacterium]|nr:hypothetical protein [Anaerolineales bacterium]
MQQFDSTVISDSLTATVGWGLPYNAASGIGFYETPKHTFNDDQSRIINSVAFTFKTPPIAYTNVKLIFTLSDNSGAAAPIPTFIYHSTVTTDLPSAKCLGSDTNQITCTDAGTLDAEKSYLL